MSQKNGMNNLKKYVLPILLLILGFIFITFFDAEENVKISEVPFAGLILCTPQPCSNVLAVNIFYKNLINYFKLTSSNIPLIYLIILIFYFSSSRFLSSSFFFSFPFLIFLLSSSPFVSPTSHFLYSQYLIFILF